MLVIMDVEATTTTVRQAEVGAARNDVLDRTAEQFEVAPSRLVADAGYGSAEMIEVAGGRARGSSRM